MDKNPCQNLLGASESLKISIQLNQGLRQRQVSILYKRDIKIDRLSEPPDFCLFSGQVLGGLFLIFPGPFILSFRFFLLHSGKAFPFYIKMNIFLEGRDFLFVPCSLIFKSFIKFVQVFFLHPVKVFIWFFWVLDFL